MDDFEANARWVLERAAAEAWPDPETPPEYLPVIPPLTSEIWELSDAYADRVGYEVFGALRFRFAREYDLSSQAYMFGVTYMPLEGTPTVWVGRLSQSEVLHGRDGLFGLIKETIKSLYRQLAEAVGVAFPEVLEADAMSWDSTASVARTYGLSMNDIRTVRDADQPRRSEPAITELDGFILGQVVRHKATGGQGVVVGFGNGMLKLDLGLSNEPRYVHPMAVVPGQVWQPSPRSATEASS